MNGITFKLLKDLENVDDIKKEKNNTRNYLSVTGRSIVRMQFNMLLFYHYIFQFSHQLQLVMTKIKLSTDQSIKQSLIQSAGDIQ